MAKTFKAIYYDSFNYFYEATIYISAVTLTVRYNDEHGRVIDRNWLGEDIVSLEQGELQSTLIYKNEHGQPERLVIRDPELLASIRHHFRHHRFAGNKLHRVVNRTRYRLLSALLLILVLFATIYLLVVPWLGEKIAVSFSKEKEISIGNAMYRSILSEATVDTGRSAIINQFYQALDYPVGYPIEIAIVKSPEVNAFAVPGGHIVVYEGILENMKTPEQLAALLGHEASHIEKRHSLRNIFRSMARKMFLLLIFGGDAGIAGYLANRADDLKGLEYSRELETEADDHGMQMMYNSGIDVNGMLLLMQQLQKSGEGKEPSSLLSTHPVFESRIANVRSRMVQLRQQPVEKPTLAKLFHALYENPATNSY
jgi:beta-barrel assembly-enhancing protease